jgi:DNA-binding SARP family transcriptional activator
MAILSSEMLPDWYDDWVVSEGEDWRQLRMDALEAQSNFLTEAGRFHEAATAARAAVKSDPLRESAQAALMRAHLAGGNQSEALRVFDHYHELLQSVLGLEPTALLQSLADGISKSLGFRANRRAVERQSYCRINSIAHTNFFPTSQVSAGHSGRTI